jgi:hypothetical protein
MIRLVTPASGISNKQRLNYASDRKIEDEIYIESSFFQKRFSVRLAVMLRAARLLTFAEI